MSSSESSLLSFLLACWLLPLESGHLTLTPDLGPPITGSNYLLNSLYYYISYFKFYVKKNQKYYKKKLIKIFEKNK